MTWIRVNLGNYNIYSHWRAPLGFGGTEMRIDSLKNWSCNDLKKKQTDQSLSGKRRNCCKSMNHHGVLPAKSIAVDSSDKRADQESERAGRNNVRVEDFFLTDEIELRDGYKELWYVNFSIKFLPDSHESEEASSCCWRNTFPFGPQVSSVAFWP